MLGLVGDLYQCIHPQTGFFAVQGPDPEFHWLSWLHSLKRTWSCKLKKTKVWNKIVSGFIDYNIQHNTGFITQPLILYSVICVAVVYYLSFALEVESLYCHTGVICFVVCKKAKNGGFCLHGLCCREHRLCMFPQACAQSQTLAGATTPSL